MEPSAAAVEPERAADPTDTTTPPAQVPCCPGTGFCKQPEYSGTISADMAKNNQLLEIAYTDLTLLHHPCDTVAHTIERCVKNSIRRDRAIHWPWND